MNTQQITNPIQTLRNKGITINTNDKEAKYELQDTIHELNIKRVMEENRKAAGNC
jgi:biotin operon repressor